MRRTEAESRAVTRGRLTRGASGLTSATTARPQNEERRGGEPRRVGGGAFNGPGGRARSRRTRPCSWDAQQLSNDAHHTVQLCDGHR